MGGSLMRRVLGLAVVCLSSACVLNAQRGTDWATHSGDPQRTGWQKNETKINKQSVKGLQLLWKLKLDNQPKALHSLMEPLIIGNLITNRGFKELAIVAGSSDNIFAVDADLGKVLWKRHFDYTSDTPQAENSSWLCPGGLTATPVLTSPPAFRGRAGAARPAAPPPPAPAGAPGAPAAPAPAPPRGGGGGPFQPRSVYVVSSDGNLHQLNLANGEDMAPPMKFMPPNGKPYSLNLVDNVVYATTAQGCGGNPNGVYAMDLSSPDKKVSFFPSKGGGLWGLAGAAVGTDGT